MKMTFALSLFGLLLVRSVHETSLKVETEIMEHSLKYCQSLCDMKKTLKLTNRESGSPWMRHSS